MTAVVSVLAMGRSYPGGALLQRPRGPDPLHRRPVLVGFAGRVRLLLDRVAVLRRRRLDRVEDLRVGRARPGHEARARAVAGPHGDVARAGRRVEVVPRAHPPLLALDDRDALAGQDEEALEVVLLVVEAGRVAGPQDVDADTEPVRLVVGGSEPAPRAAARHRRPADLREVDDEPAVVGRDPSVLGVLDLRLVTHGGEGYPPVRPARTARTPPGRRSGTRRATRPGAGPACRDAARCRSRSRRRPSRC